MFSHIFTNQSIHSDHTSQQKQQYSPSPSLPSSPQEEESDYEMPTSSVSSPSTTTRSLSALHLSIESPTSSGLSSSLQKLKLHIVIPRSSFHIVTGDVDDGNELSQHNDMSSNKEKSIIPTQYKGLGTRYTVESTIQESLFGSVHLAMDTVCKRQVAIKISKRTLSKTGTSRSGNPVLENVLNEARIIRDLQSTTQNRHIVPLMDEMEDDHYHYLITPYYNQGDLYSYLTSLPYSRMNETQARYTFKQLIDAVAYMHSRGVAHRDLSLENIMVHQEKDGLVGAYVIDFGVAAINPAVPGSPTFYCPGAKLNSEKPGKAMYISPELWSGEEWEAYSNDIFALGVILYCMLVGRQPFNSSIDIWAKFITSGKWYKLLQHVWHGKIKPEAIDPQNYDYWVAAYQHISPEALDLINHILCPAQQRYTLKQIMNHIWMNQQ